MSPLQVANPVSNTVAAGLDARGPQGLKAIRTRDTGWNPART
jgi:hypothetical protein